MHHCSVCSGVVEISRVACPGCGLGFEGRLCLPRLARLASDEQRLAEQFLLCGGNLKDLTLALGTSYPTLRKRLDALIERLQQLKSEDDGEADRLLGAVECGSMRAEEAARLIREMNGGA